MNRRALLCGHWTWEAAVTLATEFDRPTTQRSYLHYVYTQPGLVAAKCLATQWLYAPLAPCPTVCEYFGGAGITTVILQGLGHGKVWHAAYDRVDRCVEQLRSLGVSSERCDVRRLPGARRADLHIFDFAAFTVLHWEAWRHLLDSAFAARPAAVAWTDTAISYLGVHHARYGKVFGAPVSTLHDYTVGLRAWLQQRTGYTLTRAAQRGRNAVYYLAELQAAPLAELAFPLDQCQHGFTWQPL